LMAFDPNTGAVVWRFVPNTGIVGSEATTNTPCYLNGVLYWDNAEYIEAFNATNGLVLMANFVGHELLGSDFVANDPRNIQLYLGTALSVMYAYNMTNQYTNNNSTVVPNNTGFSYDGGVINTTTAAGLFNPMPFNTGTLINNNFVGQNVPNGTKLSFFQGLAQFSSSPTVYNGLCYVGGADWNVYCFGDNVQVPTTLPIGVSSSKVSSGSALTITGALIGNFPAIPTQSTSVLSGVNYGSGGIPAETVTVSFRGPNGAAADINATTDNNGAFSVSYTPAVAGNWQVVAHWNGYNFNTYSYAPSLGASQSFTVTSPSVAAPAASAIVAQAQMANSNLPPTGTSASSVASINLIVVAALIIAIMVAAAALVTRRRK